MTIAGGCGCRKTWIDFKRKEEVATVRVRPHPYEFALYFDA